MILDTHRADLAARSISEHIAEAAGLYSARVDQIPVILGIAEQPPGDGLVIPYYRLDGTPTLGADNYPLCRAHVFDLRGTDRPVQYLNRGKAPYPPYLPRGLAELLPAAGFVVVCWGELQALACTTRLNIPAVGLTNPLAYLDPARDMSEPPSPTTKLHPALAEVLAQARGVLVVPGSEAEHSAPLRQAAQALVECIRAQYEIPTAYAPVPAAKKRKGSTEPAPKVGLDDWIAAQGQATDVVALALKTRHAKEVERVHLQSTGGAVPLGYSMRDGYQLWAHDVEGIKTIAPRDLTNQSLWYDLLGADFAGAKYGREGKNGSITLDMHRIIRDYGGGCKARHRLKRSRIRGAGVWPLATDPNVLVVNSEDSIWTSSGAAISRLDDTPRGHIYPANRDLGVNPDTVPATVAEAREIVKALQTWQWRSPGEIPLVFGWLCAAYYCAALDHRPNLFLSGPLSAGKTTMLRMVGNLLGDGAVDVLDATSTTEAGIRRGLGEDSLATVIDEAESKKDPSRLEKVLEYYRSSYSGTTGAMGQQEGGSGIEWFRVRTMGALGAINPTALKPADETRFVRVELSEIADMKPATSHNLAVVPADARALRVKLYARMIRSWPQFRAAYALLQNGILEDGNRARDTMAPVIAAGWVALNDGEPTADALRVYVATIDLEGQRERIAIARQAADPVARLLSLVPKGGIEIDSRIQHPSIGELVRLAVKSVGKPEDVYAAPLARFGLRVSTDRAERARLGLRGGGDAPVLLIAVKNAQLVGAFRGTEWETGDLPRALQRGQPGNWAEDRGARMRIGAENIYPVVVSIAELCETEEAPVPTSAPLDSIARVYESQALTH